MTRIRYRALWTQRGAVILVDHDGRFVVRRFRLRDRAAIRGKVRPPKNDVPSDPIRRWPRRR